jgi:hypothetical protein
MATQTSTQRQAAGKRAAATRKRNAAKRSASATKSGARRTRSSAVQTGRQAQGTGRQAGRTAARGLDAATTRLGAVGRSAQRALLIQVGAVATLGDKVRQTTRTYSNLELVTRELNRFERRGNRALSGRQRALTRRRRAIERDAKQAQRAVGRQLDGLRSDAQDLTDRVKHLA